MAPSTSQLLLSRRSCTGGASRLKMLRLKGAGEQKEKPKRDFHDPKYQEDFPVHWAAIKGLSLIHI